MPVFSLNLLTKIKEITKLFSRKCQIFRNRESADLEIGQVSLIFWKKFWFENSFDIIISIKGKKYLYSSPSINDEDKFIYYAWKKNLISESEYCEFIDE